MKHTIKLIALSTLLLSAAVAQADWKSDLKDAAVQKGSNTAAEKLGLATPAPAGAKVYIISPKNGDTVSSPVTVQFGLSGAGIAPAGTQIEGTGHHHLLIDDPTVDLTKALPASDQVVHFGKGQTETDLKLPPGQHTLTLHFGDGAHRSYGPEMSSTITVNVQ